MIETAYRVSPLRATDPERLGDYLLVGRLGRGGMGVVYLAESDDGSYVAVKLIHPDLTTDPEFASRFRGEVERARQVPSFCTAEFFHADLDHDPPYLVVEYIDGPSLDEVIAERGPMRGGALQSLAVGVATALTGIHGAGIIHRDLKPDNVLLALGSPKVIDFGIARSFETTSRHTRTDVMVGTVAYMAPERFSGEKTTPVTAAADVFAWGCVIAFAGTGKTPFEGDSPSATAGRILTQPPQLDGLPEFLRPAVSAALAKDPASRPTAPELLAILLGSQPGTLTPSPTPPPATPAERPVRSARRKRVALVALAVLPVLAAAIAVGWNAIPHDVPSAQRPTSSAAGAPPPTRMVAAQTSAPERTPSPSAAPRSARPSSPPTTADKPSRPTPSPTGRGLVNDAGRNLALDKFATASTVEGHPWPAGDAVDGDPTTRWASLFSDPQWLAVDLGKQWQIHKVVLHWEMAFATAYRVEVSTDGQRWTTVYRTESGKGGIAQIDTDGAVGRHVRVYCTERVGPYGYSLYEIEVR
ncbi:protein kinase [Micromonospora sp. NPDC049081]|uniref:protein kinase domain-containing protein n=1 Tax=Micromonospora sp. NPDC049081 TaxID=3155150 RepID=UPI0033C57D9D